MARRCFASVSVVRVMLCLGLMLGMAGMARMARAQTPFPVGLDGELYFCPRIDLVAGAEGGPYSVVLDGILDEPVWQRAAFHTVVTILETANPLDVEPPESDWNMIFAAAADQDFLYIAWKVVDDILVTGEQSYCDVWQDDSIEVYIDALNNGPNCTLGDASCYQADDAQYTIGANQIGREPGHPDQFTCPEDTPVEECLEIGGVAGMGSCDFSGQPWPNLVTGVVAELQEGDLTGNDFGAGSGGWQGEIAIALSMNGNNDDGTPSWEIDPSPGTCIGFSMQGNDEDGDTPIVGRDHKIAWAKREIAESAWRNPGVFGKLTFIEPSVTEPSLGACALPVDQLTCRRETDGTVTVRWRNPGTANPAVDTQILVDGVLKATVPGSATQATLSEADVPLDDQDHTIEVQNNSVEPPTACIIIQNPFDSCGGIRRWNILGTFLQPLGATPGEDEIRRDYLTDGDVDELEFMWRPGAQVQTDFGGAAASTEIRSGLGTPAKNPGGVPTVFSWIDVDSRVNFRDMFRIDYDNAMCYAQCYVINETGAPLEAYLAISSDDSVQVFLNDQEVWINNIGRGGSSACTPLDVIPDLITTFDLLYFEEGENKLMLKVFDGTGESEFSVRLQNEFAEPIVEDLDIRLEPSVPTVERLCSNSIDDDQDGAIDCDDVDCASAAECSSPPFHRGDADDNGQLQLTDAVRILGFLFLGGAAPSCMDAGDADDNGQLQLTDAVRILGFLFLGGAAPAPPGPPEGNECGPDPTDTDALDCASYTRC